MILLLHSLLKKKKTMKNKLYQLLEWKLTVSFIRLAIIVMDKSCNNKQMRGCGLNTSGVLAKDPTMVLSMFVRLKYRVESKL